jgi:hypothetical protein
MIAPLFSHVPSQPPSGPHYWHATAGHFNRAGRLVASSHCRVVAKNWADARQAAAVLLGAEPGELELTRGKAVRKGRR